jgi:hypothetical protein
MAKLELYDILGRKISVVINEILQPGRHSATWFAAEAASGVYYYVLSSGSQKSQGRITLLK